MTVGAVLGAYFVVYEINCIVMCMRPEMAMVPGSRSGTDDLMIGREQ